jgi:DNA-binding SARP family transcriptional activator
MRYAILGPVEVTTGTQTVRLDRPQRRALLAVLLLHANTVVSIEQLIEALWGGAPPATARAQMHALVAAVRRTLREAGADDVITTRTGGYVITVADGACDLRVFENLTARARATADPDEAARLLREALTLWRGTALDGVSAAFVEAARAALEEQRLAAYEQIADLELARGRHAELVPELTGLVAANPLRERLVGQLMVALYRSGRQSEALQTARALRRRLAEDEGLDPGPALVELETAILRADRSPPPPTRGPPRRSRPPGAACRRRPRRRTSSRQTPRRSSAAVPN